MPDPIPDGPLRFGNDTDNTILARIWAKLNAMTSGTGVIINGGGGSGPEKVQGTAADNAVASGFPVQTGGVAVDPTAPSSYTVGDATALAIDKNTGAPLANIRKLTTTDDAIINVPKGAANQATGQVTTSTSAATFVAARATRRSVTLKNLDLTIAVYVGPATVTSGNGMPLKAGESIMVDTTALIQVIAASGTPVVAYYETYD